MKKKVPRNVKVGDDPFEIQDENPYLALALLAARALAMTTLAVFSLWFLANVWGGLASVQESEASALNVLSAVISGTLELGPVTTAALTAGAVGWVVACILSAIYLTVVSHRWVKKIKREWVWVWRHITSPSWWDKLVGAVGLVLTLAETVFWVLVTVVSVVVVYINLKVLIPALP